MQYKWQFCHSGYKVDGKVSAKPVDACHKSIPTVKGYNIIMTTRQRRNEATYRGGVGYREGVEFLA